MGKRYVDNIIYVRFETHSEAWAVFAKAQGEGFIMKGFSTKKDAIKAASRALYAIEKYGVPGYKRHDFLNSQEFENHRDYNVAIESEV